MNRALLTLLATTALAGCSEQPLAPERRAVPALNASATTTLSSAVLTEALADALERIGPALGDSPAAADARSALRALETRLESADAPGAAGVLSADIAALDRLERAEPALAAEVDAIRLAVARQ
jgi:hypothetical protein